MFEVSPSIGAMSAARDAWDQADGSARRAKRNLRRMEEWRDYAMELEAHIEQMEKVRLAETEALSVTTAAWRKEHPVSHMHDVIGKWKDGDAMRRNSRIWIDAFLVAARRIGIRTPEAWITT